MSLDSSSSQVGIRLLNEEAPATRILTEHEVADGTQNKEERMTELQVWYAMYEGGPGGLCVCGGTWRNIFCG